MVQLSRIGYTGHLGAGPKRIGTSVAANQYYVSSAGNDSNSGTSTGSPWLTLAKVNASTFNPGNTISFNGGDTFTGTLTPPSSGSIGLPITFNSYGTGQATIQAASNTDGIKVLNLSYITVDNLTVKGAGTTGGAGIYVQVTGATVTYGHTIRNNTISLFPDSGIKINSATAGAGGEIHDPIITTNTITGVAFSTTVARTAGIKFDGSGVGGQAVGAYTNINVYVGYNICRSITGGGAGPGNWTGSGIYLGQVKTGLVEYNLADTIGSNSTGPTGIWGGGITGVTFQYNEAKNVTSIGTDGGGYDLDGGCDNCILQYNYSHDNVGYGYLCYMFDGANFTSNHDNVIRYNVSVNDAQGGIRIVSGSSQGNSGQCYGNVVVGAGVHCVLIDKLGGSLSWLIANNIFRGSGSADYINDPVSAPSVTVVGNDYFGLATFNVTWAGVPYASLAAWQTATGQEKIAGVSVATQATPVFIGTGAALFSGFLQTNMDAYRLDNSSTLLGGGVNLFTNYGIDPGTDRFGSVVNSSTTNWTPGLCDIKSAVSQVLWTTGGTKTIPADYVQTYLVQTIGAGGSSNGTGAGGGGGAYAAGPIPFTANQSINVGIGASVTQLKGGDTYVNATSLANAIALGPTVAVGAEGGGTNVPGHGGTGGLAANSVGTIKWNGGNGGEPGGGQIGGGGGAANEFGIGRNGGIGATSNAGSGGGSGGGAVGAAGAGRGGSGPYNIGGSGGNPGSAGTNGAGGGGSNARGGAGGAGNHWVVSGSASGAGGGGGSSVGVQTASNVGGAYGGGGGGRNNALAGIGGARLLYQTVANV